LRSDLKTKNQLTNHLSFDFAFGVTKHFKLGLADHFWRSCVGTGSKRYQRFLRTRFIPANCRR
jgi:hypothetical protein